MNKAKNISRFMLLVAAMIWGTSFVAQVVAMKHIEPFTFLFTRYVIGAAFTALLAVFFDMRKPESDDGFLCAADWQRSIHGGVICGVIMFAAITLQQFGMQYTQAGKGGFITAMYIILVPVFEFFIGKKFSVRTGVSIVLGTTGLYMLSIKEGFTIEKGDLFVLSATIFWALHIMACGRFARRRDPLKLSALQFAVVAVVSGVGMLFTETPNLPDIMDSWFPIIYTGSFCTGVAYTLQMVGQSKVEPIEASFILCTECLFALIGGMLMLGETLTAKELLGCLILFIAVLLSQVPEKNGASTQADL